MRKLNGDILFAAHDLDRFLACSHATYLDLCNLEKPLPKSEDDGQLRLLREKGFEHEHKRLDLFRQQGMSVVEIREKQSLRERVEPLARPWQAARISSTRPRCIPGTGTGMPTFSGERRTPVSIIRFTKCSTPSSPARPIRRT